MIKSLLAILLLFSFFSFNDVNNEVSWITLEEAMKNSVDNPKPIFIDFTAAWCGWCKVMDKNTFSDPDVATYMNDNFYTVRLDYDSPELLDFFGDQYTARQLGEKYKVPGLPTILLISPQNKKSKTLVGYQKPEPFLEKLKKSFND